MLRTTAASRLIEPTLEPSTATPATGDDVLYDPADDLLPPPKPAEQGPARTTVTALVAVTG
jgi:hypothetical protein